MMRAVLPKLFPCFLSSKVLEEYTWGPVHVVLDAGFPVLPGVSDGTFCVAPSHWC